MGETDTISRQAAIDAVKKLVEWYKEKWNESRPTSESVMDVLNDLPSAQPERDIPIKPIETTDTAWGIPIRQAVCPKCDYYLGHVNFIGDSKRITYCETCGQAIDWKGWEQE